MTRRRIAWQSATAMGLVAGTYSTLLITLGAPRIGRTATVDWMNIGTVLTGAEGLAAEPGVREIVAGVFVHQSADLAWAIAFFALGRLWTFGLRPAALAAVAVPWAVFGSAVEYYAMLPRLQPLVPLQVPYWTALMVHLTSAATYPLFPWIRNKVSHLPDAAATRWAKGVAIALAAIALPVAALGGTDREPRWPFGPDRSFDQTFMRQMVGHHEAGVGLAQLAIDRQIGPEPQALAELIIAEQTREISLLRNWWQSWFRSPLPSLAADEASAVHGMPLDSDLKQLATLTGELAERSFMRLMSMHHDAAVRMADEAWQLAVDPRLRLFAQSLGHAQRGQIQWMRAMMDGGAQRSLRRPRFHALLRSQ